MLRVEGLRHLAFVGLFETVDAVLAEDVFAAVELAIGHTFQTDPAVFTLIGLGTIDGVPHGLLHDADLGEKVVGRQSL